MKDKLTAKMIRKAIRRLSKYKVEKPYYVQIENPNIFKVKLINIKDFFII